MQYCSAKAKPCKMSEIVLYIQIPGLASMTIVYPSGLNSAKKTMWMSE